MEYEQKTVRRDPDEVAVSPVIATILMVAITVVLAGVLYVWANNLASDGTSNSAGTLHNFRAEDASGAVTTATNDTLMKISWINAPGDLNWAFVSFKVEVGDRSYVCHPIDANAPCVIDQSGGSDIGSWESDEFLYLKENGADICDGSGDSSCSIKLYVSYEGKVVAGTNSLVVTRSGASSGGSGDGSGDGSGGGGEADAPTFSDGSLSSTSLDPGDSLTLQVRIQDSSGVLGTPNLAFYTANGQALTRPDLSKISGNATDGIWSATFTIPEGEVGGTWYVSPTAYDIYDNYGRGDNYYFTVSD